MGDTTENTGLILGLYNEDADVHGEQKTYTKAAQDYDKMVEFRLSELLKISGPVPKRGEVRIFYGLDPKFSAVAVVGLGDECVSYNEVEEMDEWKETIRFGAGVGVRALQDLHMRTIFVESFGHAESSAEGSAMASWIYQELRNEANQKIIPRLELYEDCDFTGWQIGLQKAAGQNLARQLAELPANLLTPIGFAQSAVDVLCKAGVSVEVKVRNWAKIMKMEAFLAAARGSCEPPIFLETSYYGCDPDVAPIVLIGKGVTFDSGGTCLKQCLQMEHMRGAMSGAAMVVAVCRAASALQLPINVRGLVPLYENMPGTCAMKPGDIVRALNSKTILVENTDFDGRVALADALGYSAVYNPKVVVSIGTVTKELIDLLGAAATGCFSNNDRLFEQMRIAGMHTGDRVWRLPLWQHYTEKIATPPLSDVLEKFKQTGAPCATAAFLYEFLPPTDWVHLDTSSVDRSDGYTWSYLRKGMSGRPTRTVIEFMAQFACKHVQPEEQRQKQN